MSRGPGRRSCPGPGGPAPHVLAVPVAGGLLPGLTRRRDPPSQRPAWARLQLGTTIRLSRSLPHSSSQTLGDRLARAGRISHGVTRTSAQKMECAKTAPSVPSSSPLKKPDAWKWLFKQLFATLIRRQQVTIVQPPAPLAPSRWPARRWKEVAWSLPAAPSREQPACPLHPGWACHPPSACPGLQWRGAPCFLCGGGGHPPSQEKRCNHLCQREAGPTPTCLQGDSPPSLPRPCPSPGKGHSSPQQSAGFGQSNQVLTALLEK